MSHSEGMEYASTYARLAATELTLPPALALALAVSFALGLARTRTLLSPMSLLLYPHFHSKHIFRRRACIPNARTIVALQAHRRKSG